MHPDAHPPDAGDSPTSEAGSFAPGGRADHVRRVRVQEAFEFAPDSQLVTDARGVILEANPDASVLFGVPKEFLIGKPLALFGVEGHRPRFDECLARLGRGEASDVFESRVARRGGWDRDVFVVARAAGEGAGPPGARALHWLLRDVTAWKRAEAARADLLAQLVTAQEDERRRVSRELHDSFGQLLTALSLGIQTVRTAGPLPPAARERLDVVERVVSELSRAAHDLAVRLRPTTLDDVGLSAALAQLCAEWSRRIGVEVAFQDAGPGAERFPPEVETALYRVVQEALTNVARHAGARRVGVLIGRRDGHAVAVVEDDGRGFEPEATRTPTPGRRPLGLAGMRERVALAGGTLEVESAPGEGTTVFARVPVPGAPHAAS